MFLRALGDEKVRAGLNKEQDTLPPNARQLLLMIDDQQFMAKGMAVSTHFTNFLHGKESLEHFNTYAQDFSNYMITKYPVGYAALRDFAIKMHPQFTENEKILKEQVTKVLQGDPVGSATNPVNEKVNATLSPNDCPTSVACAAVVAANALVVVNTVVYTNVAGATLVAVAAAAAICAAVVVCPAVSTDIAVSAAGNF